MALDASSVHSEGERPALTVLEGRRGIPTTVTLRATQLADLRDELAALTAETVALAEACLPIAHRMTFVAQAIGPSTMQEALRLVALLERFKRQHDNEGGSAA